MAFELHEVFTWPEISADISEQCLIACFVCQITNKKLIVREYKHGCLNVIADARMKYSYLKLKNQNFLRALHYLYSMNSVISKSRTS